MLLLLDMISLSQLGDSSLESTLDARSTFNGFLVLVVARVVVLMTLLPGWCWFWFDCCTGCRKGVFVWLLISSVWAGLLTTQSSTYLHNSQSSARVLYAQFHRFFGNISVATKWLVSVVLALIQDALITRTGVIISQSVYNLFVADFLTKHASS